MSSLDTRASLTRRDVNDLLNQVQACFGNMNTATKPTFPPWAMDAARRAWAALITTVGKAFIEANLGCKCMLDLAAIIYNSYHVTAEEVHRVAHIPQRTPEWYRIRDGWVDLTKKIFRGPLVSSSTVGDGLGHKKAYAKDGIKAADRQFVYHQKMLYKPPREEEAGSLANTQRGTAMEVVIMREVKLVLQAALQAATDCAETTVSIEEVGLQIDENEPFKAASADGRIRLFHPLVGVWYVGLEMKCKANPESEPYDEIPHDYYDQIQHTMAVHRFKEYVFACHTADRFSLERYEFDAEYWCECEEAIRESYWSKFWPSFVLKQFGALEWNEIIPRYDVQHADLFAYVQEKCSSDIKEKWQAALAKKGLVTSLRNAYDETQIDYDSVADMMATLEHSHCTKKETI